MAPRINIKELLGRDDQAFTPHTHPVNLQLLSDCLAHLKANPNKHDAMRVSDYLGGLDQKGGMSGTTIAEELRSAATAIVQNPKSPKKGDESRPDASALRIAGAGVRSAASPIISKDPGYTGRTGK